MCYWAPLRAYPLILIGSRPPAGKVDMYPQASGCLLAGEKSYDAQSMTYTCPTCLNPGGQGTE
uniref:Uncharacterized protein n=1 Tax=Salix viminalis TaxID=40686 RepID=A0A6N2KLC4_SALVM